MSVVAVALGVVGAGTALYSGYSANQSAKKQSALMEQQGQLQYEDALREADRIRDNGRRVQAEQQMAYISSGVEISGTPLLLMKETTDLAEEEAYWTEKRGAGQSDLANAQAQITRSEGKAAMIGSIGSAVNSGLGSFTLAGGKIPTGAKKT